MGFEIRAVADPGTYKHYVRNDGSDENPGTLALPLLTIEEAVSRLRPDPSGLSHQVVDLTGFTDNSEEVLFITTPSAAGHLQYTSRPGGNDNGKNDVYEVSFEFSAEPTLVGNVTVASVVVSSANKTVTITVDETLVPDAHVGQLMWMGNDQEGVIESNTDSALVITSYHAGWAGVCGIYEQSCSISRQLEVIGNGQVAWDGIRFDGGFARFRSLVPATFNRCAIETYCLFSGPGENSVFNTFFDGGILAIDGPRCFINSAVFKGTSFSSHGNGTAGTNDLINVVLDGCAPWGSGNTESQQQIVVSGAWIKNGTGPGIWKRSSIVANVNNTQIDDCAGHGILFDTGGGINYLSNITGSGNTGHGIAMLNGSQCQTSAASTVTGVGGDILLGSTTINWGDVPATDVGEALPHFCRVF